MTLFNEEENNENHVAEKVAFVVMSLVVVFLVLACLWWLPMPE